MADKASFPDDISALWADPEDNALEPQRWNAPAKNGRRPEPASTNGSHADGPAGDARRRVARLADALASRQVDVVRHSDLIGMRGDLEDFFTQQLAIALYELLNASNDRQAAVEDRIDKRVQEAAGILSESIRAEGDRLASAIDVQQQATADLGRSTHEEIARISDRFTGPVDALAGFEREVRHEVGRLGDLVTLCQAEADRRSEADADRTTALSERLSAHVARETATLQALETMTQTLSSLQSEVSTLHGALDELRELRRRTPWGRGAKGRTVPRRSASANGQAES